MCKAPHTCSLRMYSTAAMRKLALSVFSWLGIRSRSAWKLQGNIDIILQPTLKNTQHMPWLRPQQHIPKPAPDTSKGERAYLRK